MSTEIKSDEIREIVNVVNDLRTTVESKNSNLAENVEKVEKLNARLDLFDEKNNQLTKEVLLRKNSEEEIKENLSAIEKQLYKMPNGGAESKTKELSVERKTYDAFMKLGKEFMPVDEVKYLRTDVNSDGGYLVPQDFRAEILKNKVEISNFRPLARVWNTTGKSITIPTRDGEPVALWTGEGGDKMSTQSLYGQVEIPANKITAVSVITNECLADTAFNMEQQIISDISEQNARTEGAAFINGDSVNKPQGILQNPDVVELLTGAQDITGDSIIELFGELKEGYNPVYLLNRRTAVKVRTLKTGTGQYLWGFDLIPGQPSTLNGLPWFSMIDMPDVVPETVPGDGTGSTPIILGDFRQGYSIVDREMMTVLRNPYSEDLQNKVRFVFHSRVGGQVTRPEAMIKLKVGVPAP